jgi:hypothetical protein
VVRQYSFEEIRMGTAGSNLKRLLLTQRNGWSMSKLANSLSYEARLQAFQ